MKRTRTTLTLNGRTFAIEVDEDDEEETTRPVTTFRFLCDSPPQGLDQIMYEWTGRLR